MIIYVNKSGSDANDGTTPTLAKLTIQAAINLITSPDQIIVVGQGVYAERINIIFSEPNIRRRLKMYADGVVTLDTTAIGGTGAVITLTEVQNAYPAENVLFAPLSTGGRWIIKNNNNGSVNVGVINATGGATTTSVFTFNGFDFIGNANSVACATWNTTASGRYYNFENCTFKDFSDSVVKRTGAGAREVYATNNTFYNCGVVFNMPSTTTLVKQIKRNIFQGNTLPFDLTTNPLTEVNNNIYHSNTNFGKIGATTYATFANWQGAGVEPSGAEGDPGLIDPADGVFFLNSTGNYGAYPYSTFTRGADYNPDSKWIITGTADNSGWYNADGNIEKNGTDGAFELVSGTEGVIVSPVMDLGSSLDNTQIDLISELIMPTKVIDYDETDIRPNHHSVRIRASETTFDQDDAVISWSEVNIASPIVVTGRYVQIELTFRTDGVSA